MYGPINLFFKVGGQMIHACQVGKINCFLDIIKGDAKKSDAVRGVATCWGNRRVDGLHLEDDLRRVQEIFEEIVADISRFYLRMGI